MLGLFSHSKGFWPQKCETNTKSLSFKMSLINGKCPLREPWRCSLSLTVMSTDNTAFDSISRKQTPLKHWRSMSYCFQRAGMLLDYRPDWAPARFQPACHKLHVYLSAHSFQIFIFTAGESGWFPPAASQSQDCNLLRIGRSTSWRQNPRLVLLVLAKCLSFLWRQGRGWVQLCQQPLTYSPLMRMKPRQVPLGLFFFSST